MMKDKQDVFRSLKEQFQVAAPDVWTCPRQNLKVPKGSLIEVVGEARFEWMIQFFSEPLDLKVAWVEPEWTLFPPAVLQRGVDITRWLLLEAGEQSLWVVEELLASHFFSVIVVDDLKVSYAFWRRLQLACKKSGVSLFVLSAEAQTNRMGSFLMETFWMSHGGVKGQWQSRGLDFLDQAL